MGQHPSEEEFCRYRSGAMTGNEQRLVVGHLLQCRRCRRRQAREAAFDDVLRSSLPQRPAPAHLLRRIAADIDDAVAAETEAANRPPVHVWLSVAASVLVAALLLALVLLPGPGQSLTQGFLVAGAIPGEWRQLSGNLVCLGCARQGGSVDRQRCCKGGNRDHVTGLRGEDGEFWRFVEGVAAVELLDDRSLRGRAVEVQARPYPGIHYLQVTAARLL